MVMTWEWFMMLNPTLLESGMQCCNGMHEAWLVQWNVAENLIARCESTNLPMFKLEHVCGPYLQLNSMLNYAELLLFC